MSGLTRRDAIGLGIVSGSALLVKQAEAADENAAVIDADEKAVVFKLKDATLDRIDPAGKTLAVSIGKPEKPIRLSDLPVRDDVGCLRVSHVKPGSVNNLPFDWGRLKKLKGRKVSLLVRAEAGGLTIDSIATAND